MSHPIALVGPIATFLLIFIAWFSPFSFFYRTLFILAYGAVWFYLNGAPKLFRAKETPLVLESVRISHYVEKIRWTLDRLGVDYVEEGHVPVWGVLFQGRLVPRLRVGLTVLGDSTHIADYLAGRYDAPFLKSSPEARALQKYFNDELGPHVRRWGYTHLIKFDDLMMKSWAAGVPAWEAALLPYGGLKLLIFALTHLLKLNEAKAERSLTKVREVFDRVDALLADGRQFLDGRDELTLTDITFCSLGSVAVLCPDYRGTLATYEEVPEVVRKVVDEFRARPAGQFIMRVYAAERDAVHKVGAGAGGE